MKNIARARDVPDESRAHVHFTLGAKGYKHTLTEYVIRIFFYSNIGYANAPDCYIPRTLFTNIFVTIQTVPEIVAED